MHYPLMLFYEGRTLPETPTYTFDNCTHERRPGTTVCLRCRHEAREAARERTRRFLLRAGAVAIVVVTFVAVGVVGAATFRQRGAEAQSDSSPTAQFDTTVVAAAPIPVIDSGTSSLAQAPVTPQAQPQPVTPPAAAVEPTRPAPPAPFRPAILRGETMLADSVIAIRSDSDVVVDFDRPMLRTRRPDKFEQFVRTTLESVYGAPGAAAVRKLPFGSIASQGDLINELPTRGIRIPVDSAWVIRLFPETRVGQAGPVVVRYRVRLVPANN